MVKNISNTFHNTLSSSFFVIQNCNYTCKYIKRAFLLPETHKCEKTIFKLDLIASHVAKKVTKWANIRLNDTICVLLFQSGQFITYKLTAFVKKAHTLSIPRFYISGHNQKSSGTVAASEVFKMT